MKAIVLVLLVCACCQGQPSAAEENPWWLTATTRSYHTDRSAHYNENNPGLGVEYAATADVSLFATYTLNSYKHWSTYFGVAVEPLHWNSFRFGLTAAGATGYEAQSGERVTPFIATSMSWERQHFGINLLHVPGAFTALQLKAKF